MRLGIGMVHQHFKLVDSYTVAENVVLGHEPQRGLLVDHRQASRITQELSSQYGLSVDPQAVVRNLPVGIRQRVEILKTLYRGSEIIILDEPTAVLTPQESRDLFSTLTSLVNRGKTVIFITHKLKEVMAVANRVTVLRRGQLVGVIDRSEVNEKTLSKMMVGREVLFQLDKTQSSPGEVVLETINLNAENDLGFHAVRNISLVCRKGEIVTIAGVEGNGQSELIEAITGLRPIISGDVRVNHQSVVNCAPHLVRASGLAHVPADRITTGLSVKETIEENLIAGRHDHSPYSHGLVLNLKQIASFARHAIEKFDIRADSPAALVQTLSGGNMQKVVLARELLFDSDVLLAVSPTRGVDVAAIESIQQALIRARDQSRAVLVVSTDLDEVFQISDRILVMYNGEIVGEFDPSCTTREQLGAYMIGSRRRENDPASG
jgi:simple sugar transport system ATP-binding protein